MEPGADFEVPSQSLAWLPAGGLRPFSQDGPEGLPVRGYRTALNVYRKLEAMRLDRTPEKNVPPHLLEDNRGTYYDQDLYQVSDDANGLLSEGLAMTHVCGETEADIRDWELSLIHI